MTANHLSRALFSDDLSMICNQPPASDGLDRPAGDLKPFPRRIVRAVM